MRIKRYRHPNAFSLQPKPRTMHLVSNVMLDGTTANGDLVVTSRLAVAQYRREKQDVFAGTYTHHLRRQGDGFRMALKKAQLVNCGVPLENILVYL